MAPTGQRKGKEYRAGADLDIARGGFPIDRSTRKKTERGISPIYAWRDECGGL